VPLRTHAARTAALAAAAALLLTFAAVQTACTRGDRHGDRGGTLRINLASDPPTLDWSLARDSTSITVITNIMRGLTQFGPRFEPVPALAQRWEVSADGRTYVFHLRKDVRWSDGRPLRARDFVYSWRRLLDPATGADYAYFLYDVKGARAYNSGATRDPARLGVRALDDHTLVVELEEPASYFPSLLAFVATYPLRSDVVEKYGMRWTEPSHIVTLGPYRLVRWDHHERVVLEANPLYWGAPPPTRRVEMIMSANPSTALALYESGELDFLDGKDIPLLEVPRLRKSPEFRTDEVFRNNYIGFNTHKPPFDDPLVRRAFSAAIDRKSIVDLLQGGGIPATSWIPKGMLGYNPAIGIGFDPERARRWLAEAGYAGGRGFPEVEFLYPDVGNNRTIAVALQSMWKKHLGVRVKLANQEWKVYLSTLNTDPPHMYRAGWQADYPDPHNFMNLFKCRSGNNHTGWCNPRYDAAVDEAAHTSDPAQRKRLYDEAQRILTETDVPVAPFFISLQFSMVKPYVKGLVIDRLSLIRLDRVYIDSTR